MQAPGLFDTPDHRGKYGLVHNIGIGGAVVCSLLRRPEFYKPGGQAGKDRCVSQALSLTSMLTAQHPIRLGYNHAHECRPVSMADVDKVKSRKNSPYVLRLARL